jgi:hypothetical protein
MQKQLSAGRTTRKTPECTVICIYLQQSSSVVISKNKLNKYISFLHALPDWLYHVMMVANNHLPAYNHCPFDLEMLAGFEYSWQYIGWDLARVWIWWLGYRDHGWIVRGLVGFG